MIVTIDGPAGAGKSSAARSLAQRLGYRFLDTGAMYRAVAFAAHERGHDWTQAEALVRLAANLRIDVREDSVRLDDRNVSDAIRTFEITSLTHYAADNPGVRELMVQLQRETAAETDVVTEGRDQGTVVFPAAACKIFLVATPEERARRRMKDLHSRGEAIEFDEVLEKQNLRDARDSQRSCGPLIAADDAVHLTTDGMSPEQVVDALEAIVAEKKKP